MKNTSVATAADDEDRAERAPDQIAAHGGRRPLLPPIGLWPPPPRPSPVEGEGGGCDGLSHRGAPIGLSHRGCDRPPPSAGCDRPLPSGGCDWPLPSGGCDRPLPSGGCDWPLPSGGSARVATSFEPPLPPCGGGSGWGVPRASPSRHYDTVVRSRSTRPGTRLSGGKLTALCMDEDVHGVEQERTRHLVGGDLVRFLDEGPALVRIGREALLLDQLADLGIREVAERPSSPGPGARPLNLDVVCIQSTRASSGS